MFVLGDTQACVEQREWWAIMKAKSKVTAAAVLAGTLALGIAPSAAAAFTNLSGEQYTTGWVNYYATRYNTQTTVRFYPTDMFQQSSSLALLVARLNNTSNGALSFSQSWSSGDTGTKDFISGLAIGTGFRMAASGYKSSWGDGTWGGGLTY